MTTRKASAGSINPRLDVIWSQIPTAYRLVMERHRYVYVRKDDGRRLLVPLADLTEDDIEDLRTSCQ
jgi:hypothetical protein